jgi:HAD superfamily hydrolase (TIGR01509 family)
VALLRDLRLLGLKLAVVTSSGRVEIEPILEKTGLLPSFDTAVYGGDAGRLKPAPDPYLLAAERLNATRPLVVEDSDPGVESARAAGFDVIRVPKQSEMTALVRAALSLD